MTASEEYRAYETTCEQIRTVNEQLLADFRAWLTRQGVSEETVRRHCRNADLYINHFLLYEQPVAPPLGSYRVENFLGYWYPRKCWTSEGTIRAAAASLQKLYRFLYERGLVSAESVKTLRARVRAGLPHCIAEARQFQ